MDELRITEVLLCETGCGRRAGESGFCSRCLVGLEQAPMGNLWNFDDYRRPSGRERRLRLRPEPTSLKHLVLAGLVIALFLYFAFEELVPFANAIAGGWRPWM